MHVQNTADRRRASIELILIFLVKNKRNAIRVQCTHAQYTAILKLHSLFSDSHCTWIVITWMTMYWIIYFEICEYMEYNTMQHAAWRKWTWVEWFLKGINLIRGNMQNTAKKLKVDKSILGNPESPLVPERVIWIKLSAHNSNTISNILTELHSTKNEFILSIVIPKWTINALLLACSTGEVLPPNESDIMM